MRVVLDTAILVRANAKATGPARRLFLEVQSGRVRLVMSHFLLEEVRRFLGYPRIQAIYRLTDIEIREYVDTLATIADVVLQMEGPAVVVRDPDDNPIIYTAIAGGADVVCTADRHFYDPSVVSFCARYGIRLMTDVDLLRLLLQSDD
ncbi:MAG: putative toxin-antitoxin system toxin component, PIN family [Bryobacteraceae bacterium]